MYWTSAGVVVVAVVFAMLSLMQEKGFDLGTTESDSGYNLKEVDAPVLGGTALKVFAYIATQSFLQPFISRVLINGNGVEALRKLAAKYPFLPPLYFPMERIKSSEYEMHKNFAAEDVTAKALKAGLHNDEASPGKYRSIMDYHRLYQSGKATPEEVLDSVLEGCKAMEELRIFSSFIPEDVRMQAQESAKRWREGKPKSVLDGVPVVVKDMIEVKNHVIFDGSSKGEAPCTKDDSIVKSLRSAGAIILGVTVMTEGGTSPLGYNAHFDSSFNPYNPDYYPGGSSTGSAVAVSTGLVPLAVGMDGGGSIRLPSAMSGAFGLATTFGRVQFEYDGPVSTMIKAGPIAATAEDLALGHLVLSKVSKSHFYAQLYDGGNNGPPPAHVNGFHDTESLQGVRLGIFWDHFLDADEEVVSKCLSAVRFLESRGAEVVNITIPHLREMSLAHAMKILSEFALGWDHKYFDHSFHLEPSTRLTLVVGKSITANEVIAGERVRAYAMSIVRDKIFQKQKIDAIVTPALAAKVPKLPVGSRGVGESNHPLMFQVMKYIFLGNLLGMPGIALPIDYEDATGLPTSIHFLTKHWNEALLLRLANTLEKGYLERRQPSKFFFDPLKKWLVVN